MSIHGFIKVAAVSPAIKVADPEYNIAEIERFISMADENDAAIVVFPELCVTGYTAADLFGQKLFLDKSLDCLTRLLASTKTAGVTALIGMPVLVDQKLYNCAVVIHQGRILGIVPKMYPANYKEFYEKRWFSSGHIISKNKSEIDLLGQTIPFGNLIFKCLDLGFTLGIEICEDLWAVVPPSSYLALNGALLLANLSASNDLVSKADYRRQLISQQSARCMCGYIYASAGVHESTTDNVFGGECLIAENGAILNSSQRFNRDSAIIYTEIDIDRLSSERQVNKTFADNYEFDAGHRKYSTVEFLSAGNTDGSQAKFTRPVPPYPFIPADPQTRDDRCAEIFNIQVAGLAKRLAHTGIKHAVLGVSGGLDSTLALLVAAKTFAVAGLPPENIYAVTMPGFGTTDTTYTNALQLMQVMRVNIREIDIKAACRQHFIDIGHNEDIHDITYENVQARERTQILMNIANKINGLVIGTGDLSELALGWCTYSGDHISMYAVNCGIPKTLVRYLIKWIADNVAENATQAVLNSILNTPISPELLPPDACGQITQKTEDVIGPYELHDFFLYYAVRFGMPPKKVLFLAGQAFQDKYSLAELTKWLKVFYGRFFSQQFKRSCLPDGPKVGTISLSPRGDWRMPSDAEVTLWLKELD